MEATVSHLSSIRESFCESGEVSGFPEKRADLRGSPGNFRGSPGNFRGGLGHFRGTSGLLLSSTVRELPGKSLKNFRGSLGKFREVRGLPRSSGEPDPLPAAHQLCLQIRSVSGLLRAQSQGPRKNPKAKESHEQHQRIF